MNHFDSMTTTITGNNEVTLPAELVRELGWQPGTRLDWQKNDDNSLVVRPVSSRGEIARRIRGLVKPRPGSDPVAELQRMQEEEDSTF